MFKYKYYVNNGLKVFAEKCEKNMSTFIIHRSQEKVSGKVFRGFKVPSYKVSSKVLLLLRFYYLIKYRMFPYQVMPKANVTNCGGFPRRAVICILNSHGLFL